MIKYTEYKYHLAALFSVAVWGATFVSTKVLIANSLTPAEIFLLRFAMAYLCILPLSGRRLWASGWRDELTLSVAGITGAVHTISETFEAGAYSSAMFSVRK